MKRRRSMGFKPRNKLEYALAAAVEDPARRVDFYEELRRSELYTLHMGGDVPTSGGMLKHKTTVRLPSVEVEGKSYIPVFSSLESLQQFIDREMRYLSVNAMDLFELVRGSDVWLNPGGEVGKSFPAEEIEAILDGRLSGVPQTYTIERETQMMIGRPANEPNELLEELTEVFSELPGVKLAYNAHYYNPVTGEPPHTLIAVEAEGNWEEVIRAAGRRASTARVPDPPVDFLRLDGTSGLEHYFAADCEPFYRRRRRRGLFAR
ncbi:hypothetical protein B9G55_22485 [Saccharibacillus sp. O16]|nr:hypothetical protein B9G55_22485 [Saccharibacillus sp. O16]